MGRCEGNCQMNNVTNKPQPCRWDAGVLLLAVLLAIGCQRSTAPAVKSEALKQSEPKTVAVGIVREQRLQNTVSLPASVESDETAMLMARVEAYVLEVLVDIGDEVEAGQVLIRLDARELQQQVEMQRGMIQELKASDQMVLAQLEAAHTQIDEIRARLDLKTSERDRLARLVSTGAIQRQRLEEAESAVLSTTAMLARYEDAVHVVQARLLKSKSELTVAQAELHQAETLAGYLEVKAPFAGIVAKRNVDPGNLVRPAGHGDGAKPLLTIAKVDKLRAIIHATTDVAGPLKVNTPVQFVADDLPNKTFVSQLSRMAGAYDRKTRMMRAEIDLDNSFDPDLGRRPLRAGSYGAAMIVLQSATLPVVPQSALRKHADHVSVVVVRDGVCWITPVEVAIQSDDMAGIASGIEPGDQVVVENPDAMKQEQRLQDSQIKLVTW